MASPQPHPIVQYQMVKNAMGGTTERWEMDMGDGCQEEFCGPNEDGESDDLKEIREVLHGYPKSFAVGGDSRPWFDPENFKLELKDGTSLGSVANLSVEKIEEHGKVAPFGKGTETIVDENVRRAIEIAACDLDEETPKRLADLLEQQVHTIAPFGKVFDIQFYKLHMYKEGGFFLKHADTLHGENHMATLVVGLPVEHEGGDLVVYNNEQQHTFSFAPGSKTKDKLQWAVFYTDCPHEVKKVTSGARVILQYDLFLRDREDNDNDEDRPYDYWFNTYDVYYQHEHVEKVPANPVDPAPLLTALRDYWEKHPDVRIGVLLSHRYACASLLPDYLKGFDRILYDICAKEADMLTELKSVVLNGTRYYDEEASCAAHPFDLADILAAAGKKRPREEEEEKEDDAPKKKKTIILLPSPNAQMTALYYQSAIEHTGNESAPEENTYFSATLLISRRVQQSE